MFTNAVIGSATVDAEFLADVLTVVISAVLVAAAGVLVVVTASVVEVVDDVDELLDDPVGACVVVVVAAVSCAPVDSPVLAVELADVVVVSVVARFECAVADGVEEVTAPLAVRAADAVDDVPLVVLVSAADDDAVVVPVAALGLRAVCPVPAFEFPVPEVAELDEDEVELWPVPSALATATTGPASDSPSMSAATPARAPR
ncbi:hypothetical protein [Mycolicibacterium sphagni]|uniref:hypothetical protein n=1 Tax=Mycolicibacterium sphagni TaxID=1786 RepID=UPI0021F38322|nr:hypothetical protein [Mycolicibacterium sphagni]MCV7175982.1 hypothetical protein [Mycolicibacterium sphagni]